MSELIYLDHAATTPLLAEARAAMLEALDTAWGNPSSLHAPGRSARTVIDNARSAIAYALDRPAREIVFSSGGTEADNVAVRGALETRRAEGARHLIVSAIEHDAVLQTARALEDDGRAELTIVGCDSAGRIDPEKVIGAVRDDTALVSVMLANNEVGTVQPVADIAKGVRGRNARTLIHTDAVQAFGKMLVHPEALGLDLLTVSAHKVYGPKGCGALWIRDGVRLGWQITGGGHERGRRSGTENVAAIAGFGAAIGVVMAEREREMARQRELRDRLIERVRTAVPDAVVAGEGAERLANFATFAFDGVPGDVLLTALDRAGVCASGGSACSSGATLPSHTLAAMGMATGGSGGALRCTLGRSTTETEVDVAALAIRSAVERARLIVGAGRAQL